ncbi:hypothetical protein OSTOST_03641 [Ostertagia ostertagi]
MLNLVTAAGRVDNAAIYNLIKMRSAVTGVSFEEAAPARLCLMRKSWPDTLRPLSDTGEHITPHWVSAARVTITQTPRTHQSVATTQFGDVYDAALRTTDSSQVSGAMLNLVTAAGRVDNAAIYNLIKMRSAVTGASFEETAPARLCLMRKSWWGRPAFRPKDVPAISGYDDIEMDSIHSAHEADGVCETQSRDGSDHSGRVRRDQDSGSPPHWVVRSYEGDIRCPCDCHTNCRKRADGLCSLAVRYELSGHAREWTSLLGFMPTAEKRNGMQIIEHFANKC